ncbi:MAG: iron dicitrate transport regulator FecR [Bradyrhizobium sp.]|nr:iron dicitrate transport regulator FecR [Bradyrhizobium sp.]
MTMTDPDTRRRDEALAWIVRVNDSEFLDWPAFQEWLDADPAHPPAYEALATRAENEVDRLKAFARRSPADPVPSAALRLQHAKRREVPRAAIGWALAASLVATIGGYRLLSPQRADRTVETLAGQHRTIRLADGTRIDLNGATRLLIDATNPRAMTLMRGEAAFRVTHDAARPFAVSVGDTRISDVGTVFNVVRDGGTTRVAVGEGAVVYDPSGTPISLAAGQSLEVGSDGARRTGRIAPDFVASWTTGRLAYDGASLATVAADLSRSLGRPVGVAPALAGRTFTGTLTVSDPAHRQAANIAALLDVSVAERDDGWTLLPRRP